MRLKEIERIAKKMKDMIEVQTIIHVNIQFFF